MLIVIDYFYWVSDFIDLAWNVVLLFLVCFSQISFFFVLFLCIEDCWVSFIK